MTNRQTRLQSGSNSGRQPCESCRQYIAPYDQTCNSVEDHNEPIRMKIVAIAKPPEWMTRSEVAESSALPEQGGGELRGEQRGGFELASLLPLNRVPAGCVCQFVGSGAVNQIGPNTFSN